MAALDEAYEEGKRSMRPSALSVESSPVPSIGQTPVPADISVSENPAQSPLTIPSPPDITDTMPSVDTPSSKPRRTSSSGSFRRPSSSSFPAVRFPSLPPLRVPEGVVELPAEQSDLFGSISDLRQEIQRRESAIARAKRNGHDTVEQEVMLEARRVALKKLEADFDAQMREEINLEEDPDIDSASGTTA